MQDGMLLIRKPRGMTSHDVVQSVRRKLNCRRIGHTGTLDPSAEGLLILLIGKATRCQQALQGHDKTYEGTIRLGTRTDTADADGATIQSAPVPELSRGRLEEAMRSLEGTQSQVPPGYSAIKVRGRPAYWWMRRNEPVALAPRTVRVYAFSLLAFDAASVSCRVKCSSGTYIRSLAESLAERLGTVGHLESLTRLGIGSLSLEDAEDLDSVLRSDVDAIFRRVRPVPPEEGVAG